MSTRLGTRAEAAKRANLAGLLLCFLSILSVCLTIFNLYLFYWIWTSLNTSSNGSVPSGSSGQPRDRNNPLPVQLNLFNQLELLREDDKITIQEKLLAKKPIQVHKIKQINEGATLKLSSACEVQFKVDQIASKAELVVSAERDSLEFSEGFTVRSGQVGSLPSLECQPNLEKFGSGAPICHLRARQLELGRPGGVDFGALKSIQTSHLRTRRLHSSLNKLQLMTGSGEISFASHNEQVHLRALDLVALGSRNSTVIIKAKTIKLGDLVEVSRSAILDGEELAKQHKLCVCLKQADEQQQQQREQEETNNQPVGDKQPPAEPANNGRVFAIHSHLRCSQFTETKC